MRAFSIILVVSLGLASRLSAKDAPSKEELARELIGLSGACSPRLFDLVMKRSPEYQKFSAKELKIIREALDLKKLEDAMVPVYVRSLRAEELQAEIDFLKTPLGKRFQDKMMSATLDLQDVSNRWMMASVMKAVESMDEEDAKDETKGDAKAKPAKTKTKGRKAAVIAPEGEELPPGEETKVPLLRE